MESVAVPAPRNELTRKEEWQLRTKPRLARVAFVVAALTVITAGYAETIVDAWPWHPWREHRWIVCGSWGGMRHVIALYTQHHRYCADAPYAPLDCEATCEAPPGSTTWAVCEEKCPPERLRLVTDPWHQPRPLQLPW